MAHLQTRITFEATPSIAQSILAILKNFPAKEVKIIETQDFDDQTTVEEPRLLSLEELYGSLKPYMNGRLSDEDIQNATAEGAIESGMAGKTNG